MLIPRLLTITKCERPELFTSFNALHVKGRSGPCVRRAQTSLGRDVWEAGQYKVGLEDDGWTTVVWTDTLEVRDGWNRDLGAFMTFYKGTPEDLLALAAQEA